MNANKNNTFVFTKIKQTLNKVANFVVLKISIINNF